jgi:hypothetical protein
MHSMKVLVWVTMWLESFLLLGQVMLNIYFGDLVVLTMGTESLLPIE